MQTIGLQTISSIYLAFLLQHLYGFGLWTITSRQTYLINSPSLHLGCRPLLLAER